MKHEIDKPATPEELKDLRDRAKKLLEDLEGHVFGGDDRLRQPRADVLNAHWIIAKALGDLPPPDGLSPGAKRVRDELAELSRINLDD